MRGLFGGLLLAVGILLMTLSGLCSIAITISEIGQAIKDPGLFILPLLFGGIPFAIGFGLFKWGKWLLKAYGETVTPNPMHDGPATITKTSDGDVSP